MNKWISSLLIALLCAATAHAAGGVVIFDTGGHFKTSVDVTDASQWKTVPVDMMQLEVDPEKSASDPGYYGREYEFAGDAVVENDMFRAAVWSAKGRICVYSKATGEKRLEIVPIELKDSNSGISKCTVIRNSGGDAVLGLEFAGGVSMVLSCDQTEIISVRGTKGVSLVSAMDYGIVPSFIGDDLLLGGSEYASAKELSAPAESAIVGLGTGEDHLIVASWPEDNQEVSLDVGDGGAIESIDVESDGANIYAAVLEAKGIWHEEKFSVRYLEKDVKSKWVRPFPGKWVTQLVEAGVKTRFAFRLSKGTIWRGAFGSYSYPVWFEGDQAWFNMTKKILPKGQAVVYCLERRGAEESPRMVVDVLKDALGRAFAEQLTDAEGRKLRTHHRRAGAGIRRACTCGCTEAIETVFKAHEEIERKDYVLGGVDDMMYFVRRHVERIEEYLEFARQMEVYLGEVRGRSGALREYADELAEIIAEIPADAERRKEQTKSLQYAADLVKKTKALTARADSKNLENCLELCKLWRGMGWAQDDLLAYCHRITRKLYQQAGYGCVERAETVEVAEEIRRRCRAQLRTADGYEIWADY